MSTREEKILWVVRVENAVRSGVPSPIARAQQGISVVGKVDYLLGHLGPYADAKEKHELSLRG
jgi:hypothetical protein